jgi:hypothetical protein
LNKRQNKDPLAAFQKLKIEHKTGATRQVWQAYERTLKGDKMVKSFRVIGAATMFLLLGLTVPADSRQEQQDKPQNQEKQQPPAKPDEKQQPPAKPARQDQPQAKGQQGQPQQQQRQQQAKGQQDQQRQQRQQQDNSAKQQQQQAKGQQDQQRQQRQQRDNSAKQQQQQAKLQQDQQRQQQDNSQKQQQQPARGQQDQQRQQHQLQNNESAQQRSPEDAHKQQAAWQGDRASNWKSDHRTWQQRGGYSGYRVPDDRFRAHYGQDHGFIIYSLPVMYVGGYRRFQYGGFWFGLVDPWPEYWASDWYDSDDVYVDYYGDGYYLYNRRYPGDRIAISFYLN